MQQAIKEMYTRWRDTTLVRDMNNLLERGVALEEMQLFRQWGTHLLGGESELKYQPKR